VSNEQGPIEVRIEDEVVTPEMAVDAMRVSPLVTHAERELRLAGMYDEDADYGPGAIAGEVLSLVRVFADGRHSGGSAALTLALFERLARFKTLSPITSDPADWIDRTEISREPLWQSTRDPSIFSRDGGKTWYGIDGRGNIIG
jgi:hypothetical protein